MTDWTKIKINPKQSLLTKAELEKLPPLYSQDGKGERAIALVHFFTGGYDFFASEFDPEEGLFFGVAKLFERELGYASADEFASLGKLERDLYWTPKPLSACR
jgi:hypothetical protein